MISIPLENPQSALLFKRAASRNLLLFLEKNRYRKFSIRQLHRLMKGEFSLFSVQRSIAELEISGLVLSDTIGRKKMVWINPERIHDPADPFLKIPQEEYREPARVLVNAIRKRMDGVRGIVLFGSIAKGDADRMSDVDIIVITSKAKRLEAKAALIESDALRGRLLGERYRVNIIVEEVSDIQEALLSNPAFSTAMREGIILHESKIFERKLREVIL
jgi:predicted nucleotidyltransferase